MIEYGICAPDAVSWWIPLAVLFGTFGAAYVLDGTSLALHQVLASALERAVTGETGALDGGTLEKLRDLGY